MQFRSTPSGLLVPTTVQRALLSRGYRRFTRFARSTSQATIFLIQLATVVVLWLTYTHTVIPSQQKELLAEQLAQLQIAKQATEREIDSEKKQLAQMRQEAQLAQTRLGSIQHSLQAAQTELFSTSATFVIAGPMLESSAAQLQATLKESARQAATLRDHKQLGAPPTLDDYVAQSKAAWPNFDAATRGLVTRLQGMRSPWFPSQMSRDFSRALGAHMQDFRCDAPDYAALLHQARSAIKARNDALETGVASAEKAMVAQGKVINPAERKLFIEQQKAAIDMDVTLGVSMQLNNAASTCFQRYTNYGAAFLANWAKTNEGSLVLQP